MEKTGGFGRRAILKGSAGLATVGALGTAFPDVLGRYAIADTNTGVLKWGDNLPQTLDPHAVVDTRSAITRLNVYDPLFQYDGIPPKVQPRIAESYTVSPDGMEWRFTLKQGVKFHDGTELTAEDVVYTFQRVLGLNRATAGVFKPILKAENVKATGKHEVTIQLTQPFAPFLLTLPLVSVVNKKLVEANTVDGDWGAKWMAANTAGSGAYRYVAGSFKPFETMDLEWFPDYMLGWRKDPIKRVQARGIKETSTRVMALQRGEIDLGDLFMTNDQIERLRKLPNVAISEYPTMRYFIIRLHNQRPPLDNVHVRRAISHAFDYEGYIQNIKLGKAVRNPGPLPENMWGSPPGLKGYTYDLALARAELDKARAQGVDLSREIGISVSVEHDETVQSAQILLEDMRKIGLKAQIIKSLWSNQSTQATKIDTAPDIWSHWVGPYFVDPENWIGQMYDSKFHGTWRSSCWFKDARVDELLTKARQIVDQGERQKLYAEATQRIVDAAADVWVYNSFEQRALSSRLADFTPSINGGAEIRLMALKS